MKNLILAALYRDAVTAKRFFYLYITTFIITLLFPLSLLYVPNLAVGMSLEVITKRLSSIMEVPFISPREAVALLIIISTMISGIILALWSAIDVISDDLWLRTIDDALICTRLYKYLYAYLIAMILIDIPLSYMPSAILAMALMGFNLDFVVSALLILPTLMISALSIGFFSITLSSLILRLKEPWIVLNNIVPLLILGSGVYFSMKLVPFIIALIASATPVPHATYLVKTVLVFRGFLSSEILIAFVIVTFVYVILSRISAKRYEYGVRKHGAEVRI